MEVSKEVRERLGCATEEFDFGDVTKEHCRDESQLRSMRDAAEYVSVCHLRRSTGIGF